MLNPALLNLSGLDAVSRIGDFVITRNKKLATLTGQYSPNHFSKSNNMFTDRQTRAKRVHRSLGIGMQGWESECQMVDGYWLIIQS